MKSLIKWRGVWQQMCGKQGEMNPKTHVLTVYQLGMEPQELGVDDTYFGEEMLPALSVPVLRLFRNAGGTDP